MAIHGSFGGLEVTRGAGFDLDKTEDFPIPADEIEFAAMMRGVVVAGDDGVAPPAKVK